MWIKISSMRHLLIIGIVSSMIKEALSLSLTPPGDNVVANRSFILQCNISRETGNIDLFSWYRVNTPPPVTLYTSRSCQSSIPINTTGFSGGCVIENNTDVYSLTIENVTVAMEMFKWRCTRATPTNTLTVDVQLNVNVMVTSVSMTIQPGIVLEGSTITSTCVTSLSKPGACVDWFIRRQGTVVRNITAGQPVCNQNSSTAQTTTQTQTFNATAEDNGTSLYCTAINRVTDTPVSSQEYLLNIQYQPRTGVTLLGYVTGNSVDSGQLISLSCGVGVGNPDATLTWSPGCGNSVVSNNDGNQPINLTASSSLNGRSCVCNGSQYGSLTGWTEEKSVTFNVSFGPDNVTLTPDTGLNGNKATVTENNTATFDCITGESNPAATISLYINNTQITVSETFSVSQTNGTNNGYIASARYSLRPTRYQDGLVIRCEALRPGRQETLTSEITLDVQYGPLLINCDDSYTVVENQTVELTCTAWAKPNAQFTWKRNQTELNQTESESNHRLTSKISLLKVGRTDAGTYILTANNGVGTNENKHINVTVQYAPTVTVEVTNGNEITEGSHLELICHAEGVPQNYTFSPWTHHLCLDNMLIQLNSHQSGRRLLINNVTFRDQGFYQCSAGNGIGEVQANRTEIKIRTSPKFPTQKTRIFSALKKNVTINVGFVSYPAVTNITWYLYSTENGSESRIDNGGNKYTTKTTNLKHNFTFYGKTVPISGQVGELGISNVNRKDFKRYLLIVENEIGSSKFTVSLETADRPCPPFLNNPVCGVSKANISWTSCFDGGYKQTFLVEIKKGDDDWTLHKDRVLDTGENNSVSSEIPDLEPSQIYRFRVQAQNQVGQSYSAEKSCTLLEQITKNPESHNGPIVGGSAGAIIVVVLIVGVVVFRRKLPFVSNRRSSEKHTPLSPVHEKSHGHAKTQGPYEDVEGFDSAPDVVKAGRSGEVDGLYVNVDKENGSEHKQREVPAGLYAVVDKASKGDNSTEVPSGLYSVVDKGSKGDNSAEFPAGLYSVVNKGSKGDNSAEKSGPIYAEANKAPKNGKKKKESTSADIDTNAKHSGDKNKLLKQANKTAIEGTYANAAFDADDALYSNDEDNAPGSRQAKKKNFKDEMIYADMDFDQDATGLKSVIHPSENNTTYASIQHGVVGPPVPEDDPKEEDVYSQ